MAVDLFGRTHQRLTVGHQVWCATLELAQMYGWQPQGTQVSAPTRSLLPDMWDGNYLSGEDQIVVEGDARALAGALRRALDDLPDHDAMEHKQRTIQLPFTAIRVPTTFEYTPIEILGGPNKTLVEGVIALGEHGAFHIGTQQLMLG